MIDKDTTLSTSSLFHYTSKDNLIKIIEGGYFKTNFSLEQFNFSPDYYLEINSFLDIEKESSPILSILNNETYIGMVCFCDIPLNLVKNHINIYDKYAIGLNKDWGCSAGISPVLYSPNKGGTKFLIEYLIKAYYRDFPYIKALQEKKFAEKFIDKDGNLIIQIMKVYNYFLDLFFYTKPYQADYKKGGKVFKDYKYYDEREWRYIPNNQYYKNFVSKKDSEEPNFVFPELPVLSFDVKDITDIIVPKVDLNFFKETISNMPKMENFETNRIKSFEDD